MKQDYPHQGIGQLCRLFGKTRHAYYDHGWRIQDQGLKDEIVLQYVLKIREKLPRVGTLKLHQMLTGPLENHQIKIGRDYLFDLMREHHLHIRRRKRMIITTDSRHWMHKYTSAWNLWVSTFRIFHFPLSTLHLPPTTYHLP